jgi:hypothetical protein
MGHQHHHHDIATDEAAWQIEIIERLTDLTEAGEIAWEAARSNGEKIFWKAQHGGQNIHCYFRNEQHGTPAHCSLLIFEPGKSRDRVEAKATGAPFRRLRHAVRMHGENRTAERDADRRRSVLDAFTRDMR